MRKKVTVGCMSSAMAVAHTPSTLIAPPSLGQMPSPVTWYSIRTILMLASLLAWIRMAITHLPAAPAKARAVSAVAQTHHRNLSVTGQILVALR